MNTTKKIEKRARELVEKLDSRYTLSYVDYRDSLDDKDHDAIVHAAIQANSRQPIDEAAFDWYADDSEAIRYVITEAYTPEEVEEIDASDELTQSIIDAIRERDDSDVTAGLINNTGSRYFFYSLGIGAPDNAEPADVREITRQLNEWKKKNGATWKITRDQVRELLQNAYYGGSVGFLFRLDSFALVNDQHEYKKMRIVGAQLACIDYLNGSGFDIAAGEIVLPLAGHRAAIGIENYYVHDVCGMVLDDATLGLEGRIPHVEPKQPEPQYSASSVGNIIADDITMLHVRSWNETINPVGQKCERGHLYRFDIDGWKPAPPEKIREAVRMRGGWIARIKEATPTKNYPCAWVAFDQHGNVLARKVERAYAYVNAYCERITAGTKANAAKYSKPKK